MPPAQAIGYVIKGALNSLEWLKEIEDEWNEQTKKGKDGSLIRRRQRIVADAFVIYLDSLFQIRRDSYSLVSTYESTPFIQAFKKHELIQKVKLHRNNRSGHQSQKYGFVIPIKAILESNIAEWLKEAKYLVSTKQLNVKK